MLVVEDRAAVDERGHQGALLHRLSRPTEGCHFGEGRQAGCQLRMVKSSGKSHEALFRVASAIYGKYSEGHCVVQNPKEGGDHTGAVVLGWGC